MLSAAYLSVRHRKVMTSPLFPKTSKRIERAFQELEKRQLTPWAFFNTDHGLKVDRHDGTAIITSGIEFSGSIRQMFWNGFIEPFVEQIIEQEIEFCVERSRENNLDLRSTLPEVEKLLIRLVEKTYERMAEIDQRLRGKGYPNRVARENTEKKIAVMVAFVKEHVGAEIKMYQPVSKFELFYKRNSALVWILGTIIVILGLVVRVVWGKNA